MAEIRDGVDSGPSSGLVVLIERAIGHVVKVILHADDSDGLIGDLAREVLDLHACPRRPASGAGACLATSWPHW